MEVLTDVISVNEKGVYRVQHGDTLDSLAVKYSTTKAILIFDNNLEKGYIINNWLTKSLCTSERARQQAHSKI